MTLVADRFLTSAARTIDLATGDEVELIVSTAGGPTDQARWLARCDRFFALRHRAIASLVDYGLFGECQRFEAWQAGESFRPLRGDATLDAASAFIAACGLTPFANEPLLLRRSRDGRLVVVPDAACGYEEPVAARSLAVSASLDVCGVHVVQRPAVARIADLLSDMCDTKPRTVALWGPPLSGVRTASRALARVARLQGFVPLAASLASEAPLVRAVADRSLFLIHTRTRELDSSEGGWQALLAWVMKARRGHVLLLAGRSEISRVAGLPLAPLSEEQLIRSVEPACTDDQSRRRVADAARRADGLPGRFVERLWAASNAQDAGYGVARRSVVANRVAELQPTYGDAGTVDASADADHAIVTWPPSGECVALGRRIDEAAAWMRKGRRAAGERLLRQAVGALARRREWGDATRGTLILARALLMRGRTADAATVLQLAREYLDQTRGATPFWLDAVILSGHQAIDAGRFDEAESMLLAGFDAARSTRSAEQEAELRLALGRCLFWRGRFDEAHRLLQPMDADRAAPAFAVRLRAALSRLAVGQRQFDAAVTTAVAALAVAQQSDDAAVTARAAHALAFAHLAVGDLDAVQRDAVEGLAAARHARCPLTTIKLRLLQAEATRRQGQASSAAAQFRHIERLARAKLPTTIRARVSLLAGLLTGASTLDALRRSPCAQALALFAPPGRIGAAREQLPLDEVVDILRCCQMADDEGVVLRTVCETLRTRVHAAAAAFITPTGVVIASDGARIDRRMADRVFAIAETIPPHAWEGSIEGGAPVRYGGASIAALVARWTLGAHVDSPLAAAALTLAATAAGPLVAEALARSRDRRDMETGGRLRSEILGDSRQMHEVRQAIERASTAPFPVLVEGESGSGKELVARAIHRRSPRRDRPFCSINCAALPDDLVESELFGHARGAFTGAVAERPGVFEEAHTGTLFLDEIGELSMRAQAKVLRTIQEGELRRVGENVPRRVDVRIVAATNRDLRQEAAAGRFRLDLLYRLDVLRIGMPPLRERAEDIALLADVFWQEATSRVGSKAVLGTATVSALARYSWPGNVRELQNVLAATAVRSPRRGVVPPTALPPQFHQAMPVDNWRLDDARRSFEERFIRAALVRCGGRRSQTASELGITRQGLTKLMARLGIDRP